MTIQIYSGPLPQALESKVDFFKTVKHELEFEGENIWAHKENTSFEDRTEGTPAFNAQVEALKNYAIRIVAEGWREGFKYSEGMLRKNTELGEFYKGRYGMQSILPDLGFDNGIIIADFFAGNETLSSEILGIEGKLDIEAIAYKLKK